MWGSRRAELNSFLLLLSISIGVVIAGGEESSPPTTLVNTQLGKIRGTEERGNGGGKYFAFRGLRYANPPVKDLRFKVQI